MTAKRLQVLERKVIEQQKIIDRLTETGSPWFIKTMEQLMIEAIEIRERVRRIESLIEAMQQ